MKCLVSSVHRQKIILRHDVEGMGSKSRTVRDEAAKVSSDNAVPCWAFPFIELSKVLRQSYVASCISATLSATLCHLHPRQPSWSATGKKG
jgi:hypothetical protein